MARTAKSVGMKARASGKARNRASSTASRSAKGATAQKRAPARARAKKAEPASQTWSNAIETFVTSAQGRLILADVLEAAAAALRRHGSAVQQATESRVQEAAQTTEAAANVGAEMVSGTVGLAQTAGDVLTEVVTTALTGTSEGDRTSAGDEGKGRGRTRRRKAPTG